MGLMTSPSGTVPAVSGLWGPLSSVEGRKRRLDLAARRRLLTPPGRCRHPVRGPGDQLADRHPHAHNLARLRWRQERQNSERSRRRVYPAMRGGANE